MALPVPRTASSTEPALAGLQGVQLSRDGSRRHCIDPHAQWGPGRAIDRVTLSTAAFKAI